MNIVLENSKLSSTTYKLKKKLNCLGKKNSIYKSNQNVIRIPFLEKLAFAYF